MTVVEDKAHRSPHRAKVESPERTALPQPNARIEPSKSVKLCYTLMHVAETAGIRDLADGEYEPPDKTLEDGIDRQVMGPRGGPLPMKGLCFTSTTSRGVRTQRDADFEVDKSIIRANEEESVLITMPAGGLRHGTHPGDSP